jgi:hypothetical protein
MLENVTQLATETEYSVFSTVQTTNFIDDIVSGAPAKLNVNFFTLNAS